MNLQYLSIVVAVNDEKILRHNLLRSDCISSGGVELRTYRDMPSAGAAYRRGLDESTAETVVFVHQDVYLPRGWIKTLERAIAAVAAIDPDWTALGAFGLNTSASPVGRVWSSGLGRMLGEPLKVPVQATCLDELLLVIRRASGFRFDTSLPGFHLFGTDVVLSAHAAGSRCYVADIPVIHNSRPVLQLKSDYGHAHQYMRRKWHNTLPWPTLVVPLTASGLALSRMRLKMRLQRGTRLRRSFDATADPRDIARRVGLE